MWLWIVVLPLELKLMGPICGLPDRLTRFFFLCRLSFSRLAVSCVMSSGENGVDVVFVGAGGGEAGNGACWAAL